MNFFPHIKIFFNVLIFYKPLQKNTRRHCTCYVILARITLALSFFTTKVGQSLLRLLMTREEHQQSRRWEEPSFQLAFLFPLPILVSLSLSLSLVTFDICTRQREREKEKDLRLEGNEYFYLLFCTRTRITPIKGMHIHMYMYSRISDLKCAIIVQFFLTH